VSCQANRLVLGTSNANWTPSHHRDSQLLTLVVRVHLIARIITTKIFFKIKNKISLDFQFLAISFSFWRNSAS
jgi:hypothetical protein